MKHLLCINKNHTTVQIYQSHIETILQQGSYLIHKTFISHQSQHKSDRALINVVAEHHHHLNILNLEPTPLGFTTWRGITLPKRETSPPLK